MTPDHMHSPVLHSLDGNLTCVHCGVRCGLSWNGMPDPHHGQFFTSLHGTQHGTGDVWSQTHRLDSMLANLRTAVDRRLAEDADRCQLRSQLEARIDALREVGRQDVEILRRWVHDEHVRPAMQKVDTLQARIVKLEAESAERARVVAAFAGLTADSTTDNTQPSRQAWGPVRWALLGAAIASSVSAALAFFFGGGL